MDVNAEKIVTTLMRLARMDSGLPEADREALFAAHCFCSANWDVLDEALANFQKSK